MITRLFAAINWAKVMTQVLIAALTTVVTVFTRKLLFTKVSPPPA